MEQVMQGIADQTVRMLAPMVGTFLVVFAVLVIAISKVRSRGVRELAASAATLVWLGWMAHIYKVI